MDTFPLPEPYTKRVCKDFYDMFDADECAEFIKKIESKKIERATVTLGDGVYALMEDYRRSGRVIMDDEVTAKSIFERIKDKLPQKIKARRLAGLNTYLRFLKYEKGDFFAQHKDDYRIDGKERSYFTMMLYLNEEFVGGETAFISHTGDRTAFKPKRGSVLVFEHSLMHEGCTVFEGVKYCVRSDVMYAIA